MILHKCTVVHFLLEQTVLLPSIWVNSSVTGQNIEKVQKTIESSVFDWIKAIKF